MKISFRKQRQNVQGSVLVVGLVIGSVLCATLLSYLVLTQGQNRAIFRSQTWGASLTLSEAGVEEALAFINKYSGTSTPLTNWAVSPSYGNDGWSKDGNVYWKSNTLDATIGSYTVYITNLNNSPTIVADGAALWRLSGVSTLTPYYAVAGQTYSVEEPQVIRRRVVVRTRNSPLFAVAMAAVGQIDLKGNNIATDSFDAGDPNYNINGQYPTGDLSKTKDNGSVVTDSTLIDSLDIGNAKIKGKVKTGPNGTVEIGPNGSVGDRAWVESGTKGIKPTYAADDFNMDFPKAELPLGVTWAALPAPTSQTINGITYDRVITSGSYEVTSLAGKIYIPTNAQVILYVTGNVSLTGGDQINISEKNASLTIYMGGSSFSITGNGGINNLSKNALTFSLYGLESNTSINLAGNAALSGTIYAPQADFSLGGGGNNTYDFVGASISKTVTMNGHFNFHYDENLARVGPSRGYVATSWAEK